MWLSVLLESVRQTKLFKSQSKLSPASSLLESFAFPFFFAPFENVDTNTGHLILVSHQHHRPSLALSHVCPRIFFRHFSTALHSELTCQCLHRMTPKTLFNQGVPDISHYISFIHTYGARKD